MANRKEPSEIAKAEKGVSDALGILIQAITNLGDARANAHYDAGFSDGLEHMKQEFARITGANEDVEAAPVRAHDLTPQEKLAQENIVTLVHTTPGLRTSDIISRIVALPIKPAITEDVAKVLVNRVKNEGRIKTKEGRWYSTRVKSAVPDYQVMTYLPDGSKYLGSDITR